MHERRSNDLDADGALVRGRPPDKGSRASAGADAHRVGNPDRPARGRAHRTGAIAASRKDSCAAQGRERKRAIVGTASGR
jgi:hypothetical protein